MLRVTAEGDQLFDSSYDIQTVMGTRMPVVWFVSQTEPELLGAIWSYYFGFATLGHEKNKFLWFPLLLLRMSSERFTCLVLQLQISGVASTVLKRIRPHASRCLGPSVQIISHYQHNSVSLFCTSEVVDELAVIYTFF